MTAPVSLPSADRHHCLPSHEVLLLLETDPHQGLSRTEAQDRLERFGHNTLPAPAGAGALVRVLRQFHHPLIYVLLVAGAITTGLREYVDSAVIFGVVIVNAVVGFVQESKAEAALEGLRSMVRTHARVVRDGHEHRVASEDLVPGDLVLLNTGDKVPADVRLVRSAELRVDESALTGESVSTAKDEVLVLHEATPVADRHNMAYSGTLVTGGSGAGVVVATGAETELGEIHRLVGAAETLATPLTRKLAGFSKILTVAILGLAAVTFAIGVARGQGAAETFTAAVALAVGAIPEGLPAAVTITLAIGVGRMARRRAVIRRLPAVETLGSTTVICSDKTGTLTENQMTVRVIWTSDQEYELSGSGYAPDGSVLGAGGTPVTVADGDEALRWCLLAGAACNDSGLHEKNGRWSITGDPTEAAMRVTAIKGGIDVDHLDDALPRVATIPFGSERQYMATLHRERGTGGQVLLVKGAVERILDRCDTELGGEGTARPLNRRSILRAAERLASQGLRVLATAIRRPVQPHVDPAMFGEPGESGDPSLPGPLTFTGLQAMFDPPRAATATSVRACHAAGISVKMITGDHAATAGAIAERIGLLGPRGHDGLTNGHAPRSGHAGPTASPRLLLTGRDLDALPSDDYPEAVNQASVFARMSPEQKLRLVEALQARGQVVAMTGDGVNDAPALRQADIGVAMGQGGTEVAKDAADMVLTDDDFASIEAAVEEGRGVFDNLTKFIAWTLPTNMGEGLVILAAILFGAALPILPTQILWINMTTAIALGLMLAFEPKEKGIMARPPRDPDQPLLTGALMARILMVSTMMVAGAWWLFEWEQAHGADLDEARTAAVNLFVVIEAFYLFNCRSLTRFVWSIGVFSNRWIVAGVAIQAVLQLLITYLPAMNQAFGTAPIGLGVWLRIFAIATLVAIVVAVDKAVRRVRSTP